MRIAACCDVNQRLIYNDASGASRPGQVTPCLCHSVTSLPWFLPAAVIHCTLSSSCYAAGTWSQPVPASPDTAIPPATTEALPAQHLSNAASAPPTLHPNGAVPAHAQQQADGKAHGDALSVPEAASQQPDEAAGSLPPAAASARPPEAASSAQPASHAAVHEASTAPALQSAAATPEASAAPALQLPAAVPEASLSFDSARQEQLNGILEQYTGTHNFHNFTSRVAGNDPSAKRYISSFQCEGTIKLQVSAALWRCVWLRGCNCPLDQSCMCTPKTLAHIVAAVSYTIRRPSQDKHPRILSKVTDHHC